jgi:hypothetical protein
MPLSAALVWFFTKTVLPATNATVSTVCNPDKLTMFTVDAAFAGCFQLNPAAK